MKSPIFVRSLSEGERENLQASLRSKDTFTMRRSQMLLASSKGEKAPKIAENLGCGAQTVRDAIHDFNERGSDALVAKSSRPRRTRDAFDAKSAEALRQMLHRSPRELARDSSLWTLSMAAEAAFEEGIVQRRVSGETVRATLACLLGVRWQRAKRWITSPDPLYERKKKARPTDGGGCGQPRDLGGGLRGRMLVEPSVPAHPQQLLRRGEADASHPEVGRQGRPRAEGHLLLRPLPARTRRYMDKVRGRPARELHNDPVSLVVLGEA
jgi:transposase